MTRYTLVPLAAAIAMAILGAIMVTNAYAASYVPTYSGHSTHNHRHNSTQATTATSTSVQTVPVANAGGWPTTCEQWEAQTGGNGPRVIIGGVDSGIVWSCDDSTGSIVLSAS